MDNISDDDVYLINRSPLLKPVQPRTYGECLEDAEWWKDEHHIPYGFYLEDSMDHGRWHDNINGEQGSAVEKQYWARRRQGHIMASANEQLLSVMAPNEPELARSGPMAFHESLSFSWEDSSILVEEMSNRWKWDPNIHAELDKKLWKSMSPSSRKSRANKRQRWALPLHVSEKIYWRSSVLLACPDSGSDENVISLAQATDMNLNIVEETGEKKNFELANGVNVQALGTVTLFCEFVKGKTALNTKECLFYVFRKLVAPIVMGAEFLRATETLTRYRDRLVRVAIPFPQALRVNSIGTPRQSVVCQLDGHIATANADTGSDLDFVSRQYAKSRGFIIQDGIEEIMFADGSIGYTCGYIDTHVSVGRVEDDGISVFVKKSEILSVEFHVLESLPSHVLIGDDTLERLNVFTEHTECFIPGQFAGLSDLCIIRHLSSLHRSVSNFLNRGDARLSLDASDNEDRENLRIQRENARREAGSVYLAPPSPPPSPVPSTASSSQSLCSLSTPPTSISPPAVGYLGPFQCNYPGCAAAPFQTSYLLASHGRNHEPARPHYCPHAGCPRAQGGKGFKRRNDMIRHGIVHDSPGYVCPFCPDREHKYHRPDHLQRHVRIHHTDKSKDDPLLHKVLAQIRPTSSRRRRRLLD